MRQSCQAKKYKVMGDVGVHGENPMATDDQTGCPDCGSHRTQASTNKTECLDCGETFQSGLQHLARRFI